MYAVAVGCIHALNMKSLKELSCFIITISLKWKRQKGISLCVDYCEDISKRKKGGVQDSKMISLKADIKIHLIFINSSPPYHFRICCINFSLQFPFRVVFGILPSWEDVKFMADGRIFRSCSGLHTT